MKKSTAKRTALIAGVCLICGGVVAVALNNGTSAKAETSDTSDTSTAVSSEAPDVTPAPILTIVDSSALSESGTGSAFDPEKEASRSEPLTVVSKPTSQPPKPVIEGDSKDGKQPTNPALTDKTKKPTYKSKPTIKPTAPKKSSSSSKADNSNKDTGGDPIFGNKHGTGGEMTQIDGDGDINKQVGIMD